MLPALQCLTVNTRFNNSCRRREHREAACAGEGEDQHTAAGSVPDAAAGGVSSRPKVSARARRARHLYGHRACTHVVPFGATFAFSAKVYSYEYIHSTVLYSIRMALYRSHDKFIDTHDKCILIIT